MEDHRLSEYQYDELKLNMPFIFSNSDPDKYLWQAMIIIKVEVRYIYRSRKAAKKPFQNPERL